MNNLVLSIFPGVDLLGRAFEEEGFCVVRGPDLLWGGDIRTFHPPARVFAGIIGGPPCQEFSPLRHLLAAQGRQPRHPNMIPEFERCVGEAGPTWFVMENVPEAPIPVVEGYIIYSLLVNNRWIGGIQHRERRFSFGTRSGIRLDLSPDLVVFEADDWANTAISAGVDSSPRRKGRIPASVTAGHGPLKYWYGTSSEGGPSIRMSRYTLEEMCVLQGLPPDYFGPDVPLTMEGKRHVIGNGVPLPLGRAVARAVKIAIGRGG